MGLISKRSIGIDLSSEPASFVEVSRVLGRVRALRSGCLELSEENGGPRLDPASSGPPGQEKANSSRSLLAMSKAEEVIVGLPRRCFILRFLEFPDLEEGELKGLVAYEIERHLPFPPETAWYGFQKLERREGKARVMLLAAKREEVEGYLERVARWGLQPTAVDVSSFAAVKEFLFDRRSARGNLQSLITLNGKEASISVVKDRVLLSSRSVSIGHGSLDPVFAELKRIATVVPSGPGAVFVSGESDGLAARCKEELNVETEKWSPGSKSADNSAFGLALGGLGKSPVWVNLLPPERRKKTREQSVTVMFAMLSLVAILGGGLLINSVFQERRRLDDLNQRVAKIQAESATLAALRRRSAQLENKLRRVHSLLEKQEQPLVVLKELAQILPPTVSLNDVSIQDDKVRVAGSTGNSASDLISVFERSAIFENASFVSSISSRGEDRQGFQIQASIKSRFADMDRGSKPTGTKGR